MAEFDLFKSVTPETVETPEQVLTVKGESVSQESISLPITGYKKTYMFGIDSGIIFGVLVGMIIHSLFIAEA